MFHQKFNTLIMKLVIFAGGLGTRLSEETKVRPKPMLEIGGYPILWHIMKYYSFYKINDFIICCGYKGERIKEYFLNYQNYNDFSIDLSNNKIRIEKKHNENWKATFIDTGNNTGTGGRLKKVIKYLNNKPFFLNYGDGLSDINLNTLKNFHKKNKNYTTLTAINPRSKYGQIKIKGNQVLNFNQKPKLLNNYVNGGFFVCEPEVLKMIKSDDEQWEDILVKLTKINKLGVYIHKGNWSAMDTLRDKEALNQLWEEEKAFWKIW